MNLAENRDFGDFVGVPRENGQFSENWPKFRKISEKIEKNGSGDRFLAIFSGFRGSPDFGGRDPRAGKIRKNPKKPDFSGGGKKGALQIEVPCTFAPEKKD